MSERDDFAAFMEGQGAAVVERLTRGQKVTGTVTHIGGDSVFVALGSRADGRVPRAELVGRDGELRVAVGDSVTATVVDPGDAGGPLLAVTLGKDQSVDLDSLLLAMESGTPVQARFTKAVKGGLEVDLNGMRAFCPASQVDTTYVGDLTTFVDQESPVVVIEVKEDGRSVVVSRRKALEAERAEQAAAAKARLQVGDEVTGKVVNVQTYGAFVDLGGIEGLIHISELSGTRVDNVGDVVSPGEQVNVKVLGIEETDKGTRIRLSMKALAPESAQAAAAPPKAGEVLTGKVLRFLPHGVIIGTEKGEGFVHKNELGLPHGADHRRAIEVDQELEVTLIDSAPGRLRFSVSRVDDVLAQQDFANYRKQQSTGGAFGSLAGQLKNLNLGNLPKGPPPAPPAPKAPPAPPVAAPQAAAPPSAPPAPPAPPAPAAGHDAPAKAESGPQEPAKKRRRIVR